MPNRNERAIGLISTIGHGLRTVRPARGPLLAAVAVAAVLALVGPAREIARTLALAGAAESGTVAVTAAALVALTAGLWLLAFASFPADTPRRLRRLVAGIAAALPALGATLGLWRAGLEAVPFGIGAPPGAVDSAAMAALARNEALPGLLAMAGIVVATGGMATLAVLDTAVARRLTAGLPLRRIVLPLGLLGIALFVLFDVAPVAAPRRFGSIAIVLLFALVAAAVVTALLALRDRHGVPALSLLLGLALLFGWFNLSDNHVPDIVERPRDASTGEPRQVVPTVVALNTWLASRADRAHFAERDRPYPVFIVAAEGGGQYAAELAAAFLARAQDRCPNFAQHVFAVSAVSGGSIGAGVFAALAKSEAVNGPWQGCRLGDLGVGRFEAASRAILARDLLSPAVAAALFGDLPHAVLPLLKRHGDRAAAFDEALASAFDEALPGRPNPLREPYFGLWDAAGAAPAVLANTTQVENGMRVVVAPFMSIDGPPEAGTLHQRSRRTVYIGNQLLDEGWEALQPDEDIRLATALGLSARFPWVMPAARFRTGKTEFRLVDGAYIDNSGDETAFDLIAELGQLDAVGGRLTDGSEVPRYQLHLITLTDEAAAVPGAVEGFGDLLSPLRTMLATRPTRGRLATHRVRALVNRAPGIHVGTQFDFASPTPLVKMNQQQLRLPLTWQLSPASRELVAAQAGEAQRCGLANAVEIVAPVEGLSYAEQQAFERIGELMRSNNCVACSIVYRLDGTSPQPGQPCAAP